MVDNTTGDTLELDRPLTEEMDDHGPEGVAHDEAQTDAQSEQEAASAQPSKRRRRQRRRNSERTPVQLRRLEIRREEVAGRKWLLTEFDLHWYILGHETMESASLTLPGGVSYEHVTPLVVDRDGERAVLRGGRFTDNTVRVIQAALQRLAAEGAGLEPGDVLFDRNGWPRFRVTEDRRIEQVEYPR